MSFAHLHVHTQYSILDGQSKIGDLIDTAVANGQPALAITDHGNMFGVKEFLDTVAKKNAPLKPIVGCEFYVAGASRFDRKGREDQSSYHLIMLAKNMQGYHNLIKLSSKAYIEGFYYKPRIDHELIEQYHEGIVCCSACLGGEVPQAIMDGRPEEAERIAAWYKSIFGEDYYLEVQRHETDVPGAEKSTFAHQQQVNEVIFRIAEKLGIKVVATNDVHFVRKEDGPAHDRLICISTNSDFDDPKRLRYTQQEYLKSTEEMSDIQYAGDCGQGGGHQPEPRPDSAGLPSAGGLHRFQRLPAPPHLRGRTHPLRGGHPRGHEGAYRLRAGDHKEDGISGLFPHRAGLHQGGPQHGRMGGSRTRLGRRFGGGLLSYDYQHRPDKVRPSVRAFPQP